MFQKRLAGTCFWIMKAFKRKDMNDWLLPASSPFQIASLWVGWVHSFTGDCFLGIFVFLQWCSKRSLFVFGTKIFIPSSSAFKYFPTLLLLISDVDSLTTEPGEWERQFCNSHYVRWSRKQRVSGEGRGRVEGRDKDTEVRKLPFTCSCGKGIF